MWVISLISRLISLSFSSL